LQLGEIANISNTTISNNTNTADALRRIVGEGIQTGFDALLTIKDSTITRNTAQSAGGGIAVVQKSILVLVRSIVSGNHATVAPEIYVQPGSAVIGDNNNVIGQHAEPGVQGFVPSPSDTTPGTPVKAVVNPKTGAPAPNSLVIDGVTNGTCIDPQAVDDNGDGGVACDIGAVEVPAPAL